MSDIKTSIIVAFAQNRVMGRDNDLPWNIPEDFQYFKRTTMGKPMVMGRKTFVSLPGVLPGRSHLVVSRSGFACDKEAVSVYEGLDAALEDAKFIAEEAGCDEVFIIGGAQIFAQALEKELIDRMYITEIHRDYEGDVVFPDFDTQQWRETKRERHEGDPAFSFTVLERI